MIKRVGLLLLMVAVAIALLYISRFWTVRLWDRGDLFGLRPQGGYLAQWLRGTRFAPFELLIWVTGSFLILTWLQRLTDYLSSPPETDGETHE